MAVFGSVFGWIAKGTQSKTLTGKRAEGNINRIYESTM